MALELLRFTSHEEKKPSTSILCGKRHSDKTERRVGITVSCQARARGCRRLNDDFHLYEIGPALEPALRCPEEGALGHCVRLLGRWALDGAAPRRYWRPGITARRAGKVLFRSARLTTTYEQLYSR